MKHRTVKRKSVKMAAVSLLCAAGLFCLVAAQAHAQPQGTDGTQVHVMEAEQLEIQLGTQWAGTPFLLTTDAGTYPQPVTVGNDGVLRTEIGGSSSYVLTAIQPSVSVPVPMQDPDASGADRSDDVSGAGVDAAKKGHTVAGIPVKHIVLFGGGMVIAVGCLVAMQVKRRRETEPDDEYDDEDE